ncbi:MULTISPECIES: hypothetical protein [unclassified Bradyrhizobium]|uniref:hypothetical protein n=2 Tax=unclassified Bradyrhizobium TaxID=2631580 RepID=UPI0028E379C6|nr:MULTISPECIES: hypothetical protein [unclassified Bradyrhizobium]
MRPSARMTLCLAAAMLPSLSAVPPAAAGQTLSVADAPFTATSSNVTPLAFGMDVGETSRVLEQPLIYLNGTPGNETFLALRNLGGSGLVSHHHRLYLKFRRGRLTGWKEDYGTNWMWR